MIYVYALLRRASRKPLGRGIEREAVRLVRCKPDLVAAVGRTRRAPRPTIARLRAHDAVVRRLARVADPLLPVRFGTILEDEKRLTERIGAQAAEMREALALVEGREQVTIRLFGTPARAPRPKAVAGGPGTRYLAARRRAQAVPEMEPIRRAVAHLVRAERTERHDEPPLIASAYQLVDRGKAAEHRLAVLAAGRKLEGMRVSVSGPWAPYAFGPETVS